MRAIARSRRPVRLPALIALTLAVACDTREPTGVGVPVQSLAILPLELGVHAARSFIAPRETVTVRLVARNRGTQPLVLTTYEPCRLHLLVTSAPASEAGAHAPSCSGHGEGTITLAAGDSIVDTRAWRLHELLGGDVVVDARPGTYVLRAMVRTAGQPSVGTADQFASIVVRPE